MTKHSIIKTLSFSLLLLLTFSLYATTIPAYSTQAIDQTIQQLYQQIPPGLIDINQRIVFFSGKFLDHPYLTHPLGEGVKGRYDQGPLYRTDQFDCLTYVETVLALAKANNLQTFQYHINHIRYDQGIVQFFRRNHFTSVDWNVHNQQQGYVIDITHSIHSLNKQDITQQAIALINKPSWYTHLTIDAIRLLPHHPNHPQKLLKELHAYSTVTQAEKSVLSYLPLTALFDAAGNPHTELFNQIPAGAIIEIVRPNWQLSKIIGTNLNISHLGFAIWHNGTLYFRHASSLEKKVIDLPLDTYLKSYLQSPTVKGIHILAVKKSRFKE